MNPDFGDSLHEAQESVIEHLEEGSTCPCCGQLARKYRRSLTAGGALLLIRLYQTSQRGEYVYLPSIINRNGHWRYRLFLGYLTLGHHWDLIEQMPGERDDGSNRNGHWRLTERGYDFVMQRGVIPKYAWIYNKEVLDYEGPMVRIKDCLGTVFDYRELMDGPDGDAA